MFKNYHDEDKRCYVLMPGLDGTGRSMEPLVARMPANANIIVVKYPNVAFDFSDYVSFVRSNLIGVKNITVIAESFSGPIAIALAASGDVDISKLVLCATFASNPRPLLLGIGRYLPIAKIMSIKPPEFVVRKLLGGKNADFETVKLAKDILDQTSSPLLANRLRLIAKTDVRGLLAKIAVPCLYIMGKNDWLVPASASTEVVERLINVKVCTIDCNHFVLQEKPDKAWAEISGF